MTPKESKEPQGNLFLLRLENITNMDHELVRLAGKTNEDVFVKKLGKVYIPNERRPGFPTRPMVGLHYLKGLNNLSDEGVTEGFLENPDWQYI
ncbi:MAG: hypothetical protein Q4C86_04270 [bacterium]|nr:hypothetical protein [bacterium]